jgi:hypothetical protein
VGNNNIGKKLPIDIFGSSNIDPRNPIKTLRDALGTNDFCVSPENLAAALDRWSMEKTVGERQRSSRCIICAARLEGEIVACNHHFAPITKE